ncbi:MAG: hypothetical protein GY855_15800 [candidate division Zixibacteria bacterium]|nr:hypothetical protein [candidate division Zixibacteria bacterium]
MINRIVLSVFISLIFLSNFSIASEPEIVAEIYERTNGITLKEPLIPQPYPDTHGRLWKAFSIVAGNNGQIYLYGQNRIFKVEGSESIIKFYETQDGFISSVYIDTAGFVYTFEIHKSKNVKYRERVIFKLSPDGGEILNYKLEHHTVPIQGWRLRWLPDGTLYYRGSNSTYNIYSPSGEIIKSKQQYINFDCIFPNGDLFIVRDTVYSNSEHKREAYSNVFCYNVSMESPLETEVKSATPLWNKKIFDCGPIYHISNGEEIIYCSEQCQKAVIILNNGFMQYDSPELSKFKVYEPIPNYKLSFVLLPEIYYLRLPNSEPILLNDDVDYTIFTDRGQFVSSEKVYVATNGDVYQLLQIWTYNKPPQKGKDKIVILKWKHE